MHVVLYRFSGELGRATNHRVGQSLQLVSGGGCVLATSIAAGSVLATSIAAGSVLRKYSLPLS